jgi:hypothetical protein
MMKQGHSLLLLATVLGASMARGETLPPRPELNAVQPIAACQLQVLTGGAQRAADRPAVLYSIQPRAEDPLANYERTPLGDWQMPGEADRGDPWLRLLLLASTRPVVVDLAVFIDGKGFRERREEWIDEVVAAAKKQASGGAVDGNKPDEQTGTNEVDAASVGGASAEPVEESPPRLGGPTVAAQARKAPTMRERMMNYLSTSGSEVEREEVHWLLAEWGAGPAIVVLGPGLSWQRANLAPLLAALDQDANGDLSANEIAQADTVMKRADADGNDVVDVSELRRQSDRPATIAGPSGYSLVVMLDANTDWDLLATNLMRVYSANAEDSSVAPAPQLLQDRIARGDPGLNGSQLEELCSVAADVTLRVDFTTAKADALQPNAVTLLSTAAALASVGEPAAVATADAISIAVSGDFVEFSAAQQAASDTNEATASQLAIGAVIDGNPLERLLDRDQDGRFTLRERQELFRLLAALDRNQDGQLAASEIPVPIRLAVTLGPQVHQLLRAPTGSVRAISPRAPAEAPPDWFVSMDKNGDRDLARGEFLGTTEQFRQFDTDGDGLLSVAEVLKLDGTQ